MEPELPNLPSEIIFDILSRLPVKAVCRFKSVSKPWLSLISDSHFIKAHLQQSKKSPKLIIVTPSSIYSLNNQTPNDPIAELQNFSKYPIEILGSCFGVLLLGIGIRPFCLWNPSTRKRQRIEAPGYKWGDAIHGIGYDSARDDFKVVRAIRPLGPFEVPTPVYVFSSRSSSWKRIQDFAYYIHLNGPGINLSGVPHWVVMAYNPKGLETVIVYFDPYEETFHELPLPNLRRGLPYYKLTVLGGNLCVVQLHKHALDVWVMKESWSMLFVVPHSHFLKPSCFWGRQAHISYLKALYFGEEDGKVVMVATLKALVMYNLKENRSNTIQFPRGFTREIENFQGDKQLEVTSYVESLVSPYGGGLGTTRDL